MPTDGPDRSLPRTQPAPERRDGFVPPDETAHHSRAAAPSTPAPDPSGYETGAGGASVPVPGYELLGELGRGGMGVVYKARHAKLNRLVALKLVLGGGPGHLIRFLAEAEAVAAVKHENVVEVYDYGEASGRPFMALEFLSGGSLAEWLAERGAPRSASSARAFAALLGQVAHGVTAAHELGIVHRDLKPANVLLDEADVPKVADFGLAKRGDGSDVTRTGQAMGTPAYMSPEQAKGESKFVGPQADVWALGVMLYEGLTGQRPFTGTVQEILAKVQHADPVPPRRVFPAVPRDLELICLKCLAKAPHERYPTAAELADDLDRFARGEPISVRPAGWFERAVKWVRRKPTLAGLYAAAAIAAVLLVLGAFSWQAYRLTDVERAAAEDARGRTEEARAETAETLKQVVALQAKTEGQREELRVARDEIAHREYVLSIETAYKLFRDEQSRFQSAGKMRQALAECNPASRNWEWHFLNRWCRPERMLLAPSDLAPERAKAHMFSAAVFDPRRRLYAASLNDPSLRVWDTNTGELVASRRTDDAGLWDVLISRDGATVVTTAPGVLRVWDAEGVKERRMIPYDAGKLAKAWLAADGSRVGVAVPGETGAVRVYDARTGTEVESHRLPAGEVVHAGAFLDGKVRVVTADGTGVLLRRDLGPAADSVVLAGVTLMPVVPYVADQLSSQGLVPYTIELSPEGKRIAVGSGGGVFAIGRPTGVCDAETGKLIGRNGNWFSPDGANILTAAGGASRLLNLAPSVLGEPPFEAAPDFSPTRRAGTFYGSERSIRFGAVSPDGTRVAAGGSPGQPILVWDAKRVTVLDAKRQSVQVWDMDSQTDPVRIQRPARVVTNAATFSPDRSRLLTADSDGAVREWDTATGAEVRTLTRLNTRGRHVAYSPDGRRALVVADAQGDQPGVVRVIDLANGSTLAELPEAGSALAYGFTADGRGLYLSTPAQAVGVWDIAKGAWGRSFPAIRSLLAISPDGRSLLSLEPSGQLVLVEAQSGTSRVLKDFPPVSNAPNWRAVTAFTPDGKRIAVSCPDARVRVWEAGTGQLVSALRDFSELYDEVATWKFALAFTPDGSRVCTLGVGGPRVWDVPTGRPVTPAEMFSGLLRDYNLRAFQVPAFSPDGRILYLASGQEYLLARLDTNPVAPRR